MRFRHAFTTLELVLTIFIFAMVFGFSILATHLGVLRTDLKTQAALLQATLREAQSNASSGLNAGVAYGVHLEADSYVLFEGPVYDALDSSNRTVLLPEILSIDSVNLLGGGSDLIFTPPLGSTVTSGSFTLVSSRTGEVVSFTITSLGHSSYE